MWSVYYQSFNLMIKVCHSSCSGLETAEWSGSPHIILCYLLSKDVTGIYILTTQAYQRQPILGAGN